MFDYDKWQEILSTIRNNKLRTALTMFGVFWGIFMLVLLLGSGKGLENGVTRGFSGWASNGGFIWSQRTTKAYQGFQPGRYIRFQNEDQQAIINQVEGLDVIAPRNNLGGWRGGNNVERNDKKGAFTIFGDYPEYQKIQEVNVYSGRHINDLDIIDRRKIAVIGEKVKEVLYEKEEEPIGTYLSINGVNFKVVGVFKSIRPGEQGNNDTQTIYVPFTTFQQAFNYGNRVGWFGFTAKEGVPVSNVENAIKELLKTKHKIHPEDENALGSVNFEEEFGKINGLFSGISTFVWIVGVGTLLAGVIGVSNIMLIIVRERTREIGIRKSLGATPASIIGLILQESVVITFLAGYGGLFLGIMLLEGISNTLATGEGENVMFMNPGINLSVAFLALGVLIIFGALAGLVPASKAVSVKPVEALRTE